MGNRHNPISQSASRTTLNELPDCSSIVLLKKSIQDSMWLSGVGITKILVQWVVFSFPHFVSTVLNRLLERF